ncbi:hypothetical protein, partial [Klebsiella pneumoniae]|uniref:hypothetical protein n=1 Tax=Klebsiella pneumoniae TaxID=573 RepID=UPI004055757E
MRELCILDMENKLNKKIGGPNCIVEIDESFLLNVKIIVVGYYRNSGCLVVYVEKKKIRLLSLFLIEP